MKNAFPAAAGLLLLVGGCVGAPPLTSAVPTPAFDVPAFFAGRTEGIGQLKTLFSKSRTTIVHGTGTMEGDVLVLDQTVRQGTSPPTHRQWRIHAAGPGKYAGTLSDATGNIVGEVDGNRLHLSFMLKGKLATQQWLTLAADARSAHNLMIVSKFGIRVAVLEEEIRKTD